MVHMKYRWILILARSFIEDRIGKDYLLLLLLFKIQNSPIYLLVIVGGSNVLCLVRSLEFTSKFHTIAIKTIRPNIQPLLKPSITDLAGQNLCLQYSEESFHYCNQRLELGPGFGLMLIAQVLYEFVLLQQKSTGSLKGRLHRSSSHTSRSVTVVDKYLPKFKNIGYVALVHFLFPFF